MQETQDTWVQFLGQEDPLEEGMATHSSIHPWRIPWTGEPGGPWSIGSQRVRHDRSNLAHTHTYIFRVRIEECMFEHDLILLYYYAQVAFQMEKAMATHHSSTLAWKIPWTEEPGGLQSMGLLRVGHDWSNLAAAAFQKILQDTVFPQCFYSLTAQVDWTVTLTVSMGCFICPEIQPLGHYTLQVNGTRLGP